MAEFIEVRTTVEGREVATQLAHGIVSAGLAASVEISETTRVIRWDVGIEEAALWQLAIVTIEGLLPALREQILQGRDDENPPITTTPMEAGSERYLEWLRREINHP
jgi:periplasmic divalent cation tolerance protein